MRSVKFSDTELINGLITRNESILREFYSLYYYSIRRYVLTNNGNEDDAKDLFQDALLVLFQKARNGDFRLTCSLGTYLYSVSRFLWLKELNKRKWIIKVEEYHEYADVDGDITLINEKNERLLFFRKCFEKLSEDCRKVLALFSEGMSIAEITAIMGYKSEQHTRNRRYRCKLSLIDSIRSAYNEKTSGYGNNKIN